MPLADFVQALSVADFVENGHITNNFEFEKAPKLNSFKNNKFWETLKVYMWRKMNLKVTSSTFQFICFVLHSV